MQDPSQPSINSWLEDELSQEYRRDRQGVDATWTQIFEGNGRSAAKPSNGVTAVEDPPAAAPPARNLQKPHPPR